MARLVRLFHADLAKLEEPLLFLNLIDMPRGQRCCKSGWLSRYCFSSVFSLQHVRSGRNANLDCRPALPPPGALIIWQDSPIAMQAATQSCQQVASSKQLASSQPS